MSYIDMDHAGWVERNIAAANRRTPTAAERRAAKERRGWFGAPSTLSPFQRRAIDILGIVGNGIYNAPLAWGTVVWDPRFISVKWRNGMSTFDFMALTRFVFLCHEARIRGDIHPAMHHLEITLSERSHEGDIARRHPSLDEAVAAWREEFPTTHSIVYRPQEIAPPPAIAVA